MYLERDWPVVQEGMVPDSMSLEDEVSEPDHQYSVGQYVAAAYHYEQQWYIGNYVTSKHFHL